MTLFQNRSQSLRAGFTLIEMLAVMMIIAILAIFLLPQLMGASKSVEVQSTKTFILQVEGTIHDYENEKGDFPRSTFPRDLDPKPTATNMGIEMLIISLWPASGAYQAFEVKEERLGNTDNDGNATSLTSFSSGEVFELIDHWGNPIAYFHSRDYDESMLYRTLDEEGNEVDNDVIAVMSAKTGDPMNKRSFQLISAGPDGIFGTGDDVGNFEKEGTAP